MFLIRKNLSEAYQQLFIYGKQAIKMPKKGDNILKFNNFHKQQPVPFVIYADMKAITKKVHGCRPSNKKSYINAYQTHEDCGYAYKLVCCHKDKYSKPIQMYRREKPFTNSWKRCLKRLNTVRRL